VEVVLVVPEPYVIPGPVLLDEIVLKDQGLLLGACDHYLHFVQVLEKIADQGALVPLAPEVGAEPGP